MANNRMYLECRGCGEKILIGKVNSSEYTCFYENMNETLDNFFKKHPFCSKNKEVHNENQFELKYETLYEEGE